MVNSRPNSWNEITVAKFVELYSLNRDKFKTEDEYNIHLLSILTDTDVEKLEEIEYEEYEKLLLSISFIRTLPSKPAKYYVNTEAGLLHLKDNFNTLTIGEFVDLENLFTQGYIKNLPIILAILYRQKDIKKTLLYLDRFEPYGDWIFHRAQLFYDLPITEVYGICNKYLEYRADIFEKYSGLFDEVGDDSEEPFDENESVIARAEKRKEEARQKSLKKWGWDVFILRLAQNDPIRLDEATKIPLLQALNILAMKKELGIQE